MLSTQREREEEREQREREEERERLREPSTQGLSGRRHEDSLSKPGGGLAAYLLLLLLRAPPGSAAGRRTPPSLAPTGLSQALPRRACAPQCCGLAARLTKPSLRADPERRARFLVAAVSFSRAAALSTLKLLISLCSNPRFVACLRSLSKLALCRQ